MTDIGLNTVRHKNTPKFIDRNLKTDDQILMVQIFQTQLAIK